MAIRIVRGRLTVFDMNVRGIQVRESENPPAITDMSKTGEFFFCKKFAQEFLLRTELCKRISAAQKRLPSGYRFMLYEAFRPRSRQVELWNNVLVQLHGEHPDWSQEQCELIAGDKYVANPHGFGSGHQSGAAVDITLCSEMGQEFFMGTKVQEFNDRTRTDCDAIGKEEIERRNILRHALEAEGVINFPEEWWHFSYGDRLWAEITKHDEAFYAPID